MKPVYLVALGLTLAATGWTWLQDRGMFNTDVTVVEVSTPRQRKTERQPDPPTPAPTTAITRAALDPAGGDPFNAVVPPPPPPPSARRK